MMGDADVLIAKKAVQRLSPGSLQGLEIAEAAQPHRKVRVLAFMPDRNAGLTKSSEPRDLLGQGIGDRSEEDNLFNPRQTRKCLRHVLGGN